MTQQRKANRQHQQHQQRVLDEKRELDERLSKLDAFILDNPLYRQLPTSEQDRMARQSKAMAAYSGVLAERIEAFGAPAATPPQAATITLPVVDPGPDSLEREIQTKADATPRWAQGQAPRVTMDMVNAQIVGETYTVLPSGRVTVCELTLANGFTVRGESAVVFIENNVPQIGREIARENAVNQIWPLLGFRLRDQLSAA